VELSTNETHIFLTNDYFDISMEYIDFFVPEELQDNLRYVTPCDTANGFYCQGDYEDPIYGESELFHIKTNPVEGADFYALVDYLFDYESLGVNVSEAIDFEVWDGTNAILYNVGNIVIYQESYYQCKQQIFNHNGLPTSLTQYWEEVQPGERTDVPEGFGNTRINYEITMDYNSVNENSVVLEDLNTDNISISLNAKGQRLILSWDYYNGGEVVSHYEKSFQGSEAEYELLENSCDENYRFCQAIIKTNLNDEGKLLDAINFDINKVR
jgi:hypothetical protein